MLKRLVLWATFPLSAIQFRRLLAGNIIIHHVGEVDDRVQHTFRFTLEHGQGSWVRVIAMEYELVHGGRITINGAPTKQLVRETEFSLSPTRLQRLRSGHVVIVRVGDAIGEQVFRFTPGHGPYDAVEVDVKEYEWGGHAKPRRSGVKPTTRGQVRLNPVGPPRASARPPRRAK